MRKLFFTLFFFGASLLHASAEKFMTIEFADGSEQSFALSGAPRVSFGSATLVVSVQNASGEVIGWISVDKPSVKRYYFGSSDKVRGIPTQIYQRYMIDFP